MVIILNLVLTTLYCAFTFPKLLSQIAHRVADTEYMYQLMVKIAIDLSGMVNFVLNTMKSIYI